MSLCIILGLAVCVSMQPTMINHLVTCLLQGPAIQAADSPAHCAAQLEEFAVITVLTPPVGQPGGLPTPQNGFDAAYLLCIQLDQFAAIKTSMIQSSPWGALPAPLIGCCRSYDALLCM